MIDLTFCGDEPTEPRWFQRLDRATNPADAWVLEVRQQAKRPVGARNAIVVREHYDRGCRCSPSAIAGGSRAAVLLVHHAKPSA
jgi:hypothetical protein